MRQQGGRIVCVEIQRDTDTPPVPYHTINLNIDKSNYLFIMNEHDVWYREEAKTFLGKVLALTISIKKYTVAKTGNLEPIETRTPQNFYERELKRDLFLTSLEMCRWYGNDTCELIH